MHKTDKAELEKAKQQTGTDSDRKQDLWALRAD